MISRQEVRARCENFLVYAQRTFPGGFFFAAAAAEFDTRPGVVRDRIAEYHAGWTTVLADITGQACQAGQLDALGTISWLLAQHTPRR